MFVVSGKPAETPRKAFEVQKVFAFAPPHILCSLCCVWHLPPTDKLLDFLLFFFVFFFFWIFSNTSICILNMSRKWLPSQLLSLCLADKQGMSVYVTQTEYTSPQIPPCSMCYKVPEHKWGRRGKDRSKPCRVFFFFKLRQIMFGIIVKICLTMLDEKFMSSWSRDRKNSASYFLYK